MNILYNIAMAATGWGMHLASPWHHKAKLTVQGQARTISYLKETLDPDGGYIWIHAASLGEFEQGGGKPAQVVLFVCGKWLSRHYHSQGNSRQQMSGNAQDAQHTLAGGQKIFKRKRVLDFI